MKNSLPVLLLNVAAGLLLCNSALAGNASWNGGTGAWNIDSNWNPAAPGVPNPPVGTANGDQATFNTSSGTVTVDANRTLSSIIFDTGAGSYTLTGGSLILSNNPQIQLTSGLTGSNITETINTPISAEGVYQGFSIINNNANATDTIAITGTLGNTGPAMTSVTLNGGNTGANTISGSIVDSGRNTANLSSGQFGVTKNGAGNWILSGINTYSGSTNVNGGTLQIANTLALQNSDTSISTANGLTFSAGLGSATMRELSGSSNETLTDLGSNGVTLNIGTYWNTYSETYNGALSGLGGINKFGFSTETFTTSNTYTGATSVSPLGTLKSTLSASGTPFGTGVLALNGGTLALSPSTSGASTLTGASGITSRSALTYASGSDIFLTKNGGNLTFTIGGGGTAALTRVDEGTLTIQTANTGDLGSGENIVVNGTAPATTNGMVDASIVGYGTTSSNQFDFLTYNSGTGFGVATYTNISTAGSTSIADVSGSYTVAANQNVYALRIEPGNTLTIGSGATLTVGDGIHTAGLILGGSGFYGENGSGINGSGTLNFGTKEGLIYADGGWSDIQSVIAGSGGLTFSGITNSGNTSLSDNGETVQLDNVGNTFSGGITVNSGATLVEANRIDANGSLGDPNNAITLNGGALGSAGNLSFLDVGRSVVLGTAGGALYGSQNNAANISGTGPLLIRTNPGGNGPTVNNKIMVLSGNNTFTGGLVLAQGMVAVSSEQNLGAATSPITIDGGIFKIMGTSLNNFGSHPVSFANDDYPTPLLNLDIENAGNIFTLGQVGNQPDYGIAKYGLGTLVLTTPNTYGGEVDVWGGTLKVDATQGGTFTNYPALKMAGGTLYILGNSAGTNLTLSNVSLGISGTYFTEAPLGGGSLIVDNNGGNTVVTLGALYPSSSTNNAAYSGSALDIAVTGSGTSTVTTTSAPDSTGTGAAGIYGARIVYTTASGTDWASSTSAGPTYTLSAYTAYDDFDPQLVTFTGNNILLDATNSGYFGGDSFTKNLSANTVKIDANSSTNTVLDLSGFKLTLTGGGLLFTGTNDFTIQNGTLVSGLAGIAGNNNPNGDDFIIQDYSTTNKLTISAAIVDGADGPSSLTKAGPGTLVLSGTNTYSGQTFIDGGILSVASTNFGTTSQFNLNGGTLQVTGTAGWTKTLPGTLQVGTAGSTLDIANGGVLSVNTIRGISQGFSTGATADGGLTVNSSDSSGGTVALGSDIGFTGGLNILGGVVRLTSSQSLYFPVNYLTFGSSSQETLQLNGNNAFVSGLVSSSTNAVVENGNGSGNNVVFGVANGDDETYAGMLINKTGIGTDTGTGTLGFLKAGAGTLSLTNANSSYTGVTEIDGGALNVASLTNGGANSTLGASPNVASSLVFGGGTLQYTGLTAQSTDRLFTLGDAGNSATGTGGVGGNSGAIDASGSTGAATVTFSNTNPIAFGNIGTHTLTLTGTNSGSGSGATANLNTFAPLVSDSSSPTSVTKSDTGSWAITNGSNSYSGGTSVTAGTLFVDNATGSGTGSGAVTVDGGTLSGTGQIAPSGTHGITVTAVGTVAPGGVQATVPITGTPGTQAYGNLTLGTTSFTGGGPGTPTGTGSTSPLVTLNSANLTFALGAGTTTVVNGITGISENTTGSKLIIGGTAPNTITFTGESVVTINDLVGAGLSLHQEYMLIQGNGFTTYDTGAGSSLVVSTTFTPNYGYAITGGITLLQSAGNFYSAFYQGSTLFLNGDNIDVAVIPEPSTWALLLGGAGLLVFLRRRANRVRAD